ncbi:MAG TPA: hypothetical protein VLK23_08315, partial [Thermodesulfobacteriota bacterium]|nr:hypothetical protein [Thermodesulfobacteriota bacterium]
HMEVIHLRQITLRGIPGEVERMIKKEAEKNGSSLNKAFISVLEKTIGKKKKVHDRKLLHRDLDHLCGVWTKREAEEFIKSVEFQRTVDEDVWKKTRL